jgi:5-methylcytosine-specific restriction endonuclease McrBC GTP-binding regulatory subunit McrB
LNQLDEQDEGRTIKLISALNIADGYSRVIQGVMKHQIDSISQGDWKIYKMVIENTENDD